VQDEKEASRDVWSRGRKKGAPSRQRFAPAGIVPAAEKNEMRIAMAKRTPRVYLRPRHGLMATLSLMRATPTVSHPKLLLLFFLAKTEKTFSNGSPSQIVIYPKLGKTDSTRAYMRAAIHGASSRIRRGGRI
jgi:hypothetical protein